LEWINWMLDKIEHDDCIEAFMLRKIIQASDARRAIAQLVLDVPNCSRRKVDPQYIGS